MMGVMKRTPTNQAPADRTSGETAADRPGPLAVWRIGITGGLTAILCCVGPTVLGIAVGTYVVLYAVTTWLGTLA